MELKTRNVNSAFRELLQLFSKGERGIREGGGKLVEQGSRNGKVLRIDEPVTITYEKPLERVLFNQARDNNPFLVLFESLYHLAGRNDVAPLQYYCSRMKEFSDDGETFNGSYGYRWRKALTFGEDNIGEREVDQLQILISHFKANPDSRRVVLQMWSVQDDLLKIGGYGNRILCTKCYGVGGPVYYDEDENKGEKCNLCKGACWIDEPASRDVCCNLSVMFSIREVENPKGYVDALSKADPPIYHSTYKKHLDMTVTNRSNDLVWGLLGVNVVQFSILQEYVAASLGVEVGKYHHFTNNLHAYVERDDWKPEAWLADEATASYTPTSGAEEVVKPYPLVKNPAAFDEELPLIVERYSGKEYTMGGFYSEPFFMNVAQPMFLAHQRYKMYKKTTLTTYYDGALEVIETCKADDWRIAGTNWIERRKPK